MIVFAVCRQLHVVGGMATGKDEKVVSTSSTKKEEKGVFELFFLSPSKTMKFTLR